MLVPHNVTMSILMFVTAAYAMLYLLKVLLWIQRSAILLNSTSTCVAMLALRYIP